MADVYIDNDQTVESILFTRLLEATSKADRAIFFSPNNTSISVDDHKEQYSTVKLPFPFPLLQTRDEITIVGTYYGIILLHVHVNITREAKFPTSIVQYNPSTGVTRIIRDPNPSSSSVYGFSICELKIVRLRRDQKGCKYCDVLSLKTSTWSTSRIRFPDTLFHEDNNVGTFLNGFLYWFASTKIVVLSVKKIVVSEINLPNPHSYANTHLGTLHGHLCMITDTNDILNSGHDLWVMKERGVEKSWSRVYSFALGLGDDHIAQYRILNIMDDGRILMVDTSSNLIIYDTSKRSYRKLNTSESVIDFRTISGIEYLKTRISPSEFC